MIGFAIVPLLLAVGAAPPDVRISLETSEPKITVAETFRVTVTVASPRLPEAEILKTARTRKYLITLPGKTLDMPNALTIRTVENRSEERDGQIIDTWSYLMDPQWPGPVEFPALDIELRPVKGDAVSLRTEPVKVAIVPILTDAATAQLCPAAPMLRESTGGWGWGLLIILAMGGAAYYWFHWRPNQLQPAPAAAPKTPERDSTLARLNQARTPLEASGILRDYLRERFGLKEVVTDWRNIPGLPEESREELAGLGRDLDSVLYGRGAGTLSPELKLRLQDFIRAI